MKFKKVLALFVMGMMLLSGCSVKNTKVNETKKTETKILKVGVAADHKPWCYKDGDKIVGIDVDVLNEVAKRMGDYKVEFHLASFEGMFGLLDTGKVDTVAQQITVTNKRKEKYVFSEFYAFNPHKLLVRESDNSINKLEDLKGKTFACEPAGAELHNIEEYKAKNDPNNEIKVLVSEVSGRELVAQNNADACLYPVAIFDMMKKESGLAVKQVGEPVYEEENAFPFRKDADKELLEKFNKALKSMKEDGTLKKIYMDKFGVDLSERNALRK